MWTIGYIHYITNKIAYITYSHVDQDIPYQLKCNKGLSYYRNSVHHFNLKK